MTVTGRSSGVDLRKNRTWANCSASRGWNFSDMVMASLYLALYKASMYHPPKQSWFAHPHFSWHQICSHLFLILFLIGYNSHPSADCNKLLPLLLSFTVMIIVKIIIITIVMFIRTYFTWWLFLSTVSGSNWNF